MDLISSAIARWLVREQIITADKQHLYAFAVYSLFWGLLPLFITMLLGIALGMVKEGIAFILPYILLRKFCGGYHLRTRGACIFALSLVIAMSLVFIKHIAISNSFLVLSILVVCSVVSIYIHSPIDSKARSLSPKEIKVFKQISQIIAIIFLLLYLFFLGVGSLTIATSLGAGIIVSAMLQLPCLLREE